MAKGIISDFEKAKVDLKTAEDCIRQYEKDNLALTKKQLDQLYCYIKDAKARIKKNCPHIKTFIHSYEWVDQGIGLDRHYTDYGISCDDCGTTFVGERGQKVYGPFLLSDAAIKFDKDVRKLKDEELYKMGVRRYTVIETKYSVR